MKSLDLTRIHTRDDMHRANLQMRERALGNLRSLLKSRKLTVKLFVTRMEIMEQQGYDPADEERLFAILRGHMAELREYRATIKTLIMLIRDIDRDIFAEAAANHRH